MKGLKAGMTVLYWHRNLGIAAEPVHVVESSRSSHVRVRPLAASTSIPTYSRYDDGTFYVGKADLYPAKPEFVRWLAAQGLCNAKMEEKNEEIGRAVQKINDKYQGEIQRLWDETNLLRPGGDW